MHRILTSTSLSLIAAMLLFSCGPGGAEESALVTTLDDVEDPNDGEVSLREAVSFALSSGERVTFASELDGALVLTGPIVLEGSGALEIGGENRIMLDAAGASRHFEGGGPDLTLSNLTLTNGVAGESSEGGGSIYMTTGKLTVAACAFEANRHSSDIGSGGAIHIAEGADLEISGATFSGNLARREGGAIYNASPRPTSIEDASFSGQKGDQDGAELWGASIYHVGGDLTVRGGEFRDEQSARGALYASMLEGAVEVVEGTFEGNAGEIGGAIYVEYSGTDGMADVVSLNVSDSTFTDNTSEVAGGAIAAREWTKVTVNKSTFTGNQATLEGEGGGTGGAISSKGALVIAESTFSENSAAFQGGALEVGGLTNEHRLEVSTSSFSKNSSGEGGAVYAVFAKSVAISGSEFEENSATNGGGAGSLAGASIAIEGSSFTKNTTSDESNGGALFLSEDTSIQGSTFSENSGHFGGAIYIRAAALTLDAQTSITGNTATVPGDVAEGKGGGVCNEDADVTLGGAMVSGNNPDDFCVAARVN